ncbi:MAG: RluA family pseudouridine synthase [Pseudomonadota bacterium]
MKPPLPQSPYNPPPAESLKTLYIDDHIVVASKPAGLLSVPGRGPEKAFCAVSILSVRHGDVLTVHRLDMDTSGIVVFARTKPAQSRLARAFQDRRVEKTYTAIVHGTPDPVTSTINLPIATFSHQRPLRHIDENGREAITHYETLKTEGAKSLLSLKPETGRSHQLRLHLKSIGVPILGDRFYGIGDESPHLLLHATTLSFRHPHTNERQHYTAPIPDYFPLKFSERSGESVAAQKIADIQSPTDMSDQETDQ